MHNASVRYANYAYLKGRAQIGRNSVSIMAIHIWGKKRWSRTFYGCVLEEQGNTKPRRTPRRHGRGLNYEVNYVPVPTISLPKTASRGWTGDFLTYQMKPGKPHYEPILANQFSVWIKRGDGTATIYATLMSDNFAANPVAVVLNPREAPKDRYLQVANC